MVGKTDIGTQKKLVNEFCKAKDLSKKDIPIVVGAVHDVLKDVASSNSHVVAKPMHKTFLEAGDVRWGQFIFNYLNIETGQKTLVFMEVGSLRLYSISGFSDSPENQRLKLLDDTFMFIEELIKKSSLQSLVDIKKQ